MSTGQTLVRYDGTFAEEQRLRLNAEQRLVAMETRIATIHQEHRLVVAQKDQRINTITQSGAMLNHENMVLKRKVQELEETQQKKDQEMLDILNRYKSLLSNTNTNTATTTTNSTTNNKIGVCDKNIKVELNNKTHRLHCLLYNQQKQKYVNQFWPKDCPTAKANYTEHRKQVELFSKFIFNLLENSKIITIHPPGECDGCNSALAQASNLSSKLAPSTASSPPLPVGVDSATFLSHMGFAPRSPRMSTTIDGTTVEDATSDDEEDHSCDPPTLDLLAPGTSS